MIGTPLYMSPEQAEMSGAGRRHAQRHLLLGVLLYELLTGTTPFDPRTMASGRHGRDAADDPRGGAAAAQHAAQHARRR